MNAVETQIAGGLVPLCSSSQWSPSTAVFVPGVGMPAPSFPGGRHPFPHSGSFDTAQAGGIGRAGKDARRKPE